MLNRDKKLNLDLEEIKAVWWVGQGGHVSLHFLTCHFSPILKDWRRWTVNESAPQDFFVTSASFDWK